MDIWTGYWAIELLKGNSRAAGATIGFIPRDHQVSYFLTTRELIEHVKCHLDNPCHYMSDRRVSSLRQIVQEV